MQTSSVLNRHFRQEKMSDALPRAAVRARHSKFVTGACPCAQTGVPSA